MKVFFSFLFFNVESSPLLFIIFADKSIWGFDCRLCIGTLTFFLKVEWGSPLYTSKSPYCACYRLCIGDALCYLGYSGISLKLGVVYVQSPNHRWKRTSAPNWSTVESVRNIGYEPYNLYCKTSSGESEVGGTHSHNHRGNSTPHKLMLGTMKSLNKTWKKTKRFHITE